MEPLFDSHADGYNPSHEQRPNPDRTQPADQPRPQPRPTRHLTHEPRRAPEDDVRHIAQHTLTAYGLDPDLVTGLTIELNPYGIQQLVVRLIITPAALHALTCERDA